MKYTYVTYPYLLIYACLVAMLVSNVMLVRQGVGYSDLLEKNAKLENELKTASGTLKTLQDEIEALRCNPFYGVQKDKMLIPPMCERDLEDSQTQGYGITKWREAYGGMGLGGHPGIDYAAPEGTPVRASSSGTVFEAYGSHDNLVDGKVGYGNRVKIRQRNGQKGFETVYAHLSEVFVEVGDKVRQGQLIGYVGDTGFSSKPHLHWGVRFLWFCDESNQIDFPCEVLDGHNGMLGWVDPRDYVAEAKEFAL